MILFVKVFKHPVSDSTTGLPYQARISPPAPIMLHVTGQILYRANASISR
jgi:hypothetical protein